MSVFNLACFCTKHQKKIILEIFNKKILYDTIQMKIFKFYSNINYFNYWKLNTNICSIHLTLNRTLFKRHWSSITLSSIYQRYWDNSQEYHQQKVRQETCRGRGHLQALAEWVGGLAAVIHPPWTPNYFKLYVHQINNRKNRSGVESGFGFLRIFTVAFLVFLAPAGSSSRVSPILALWDSL